MVFGFEDELKDGSNLRTINGEEFVLFKSKLGIVKFLNVCTHRGAKLFSPDSAKKSIFCDYHVASYDKRSGSIINTDKFDKRLFCTSLLKFENLHQGGNLVVDDDFELPPEVVCLLKDADFTELEVIKHECSQELLIENVLEIEHVNSLHRKSFVPLGMKSESPFTVNLEAWGSSLVVFDRVDSSKPIYQHYFIRPNLFVSLTHNRVGYIGYVEANSEVSSCLRYRFFCGPELQNKPAIIKKTALAEAQKFTRQVLFEDKPLVEGQQQNIAYRSEVFLAGDHDQRLAHYFKSIRGVK